MPSTGRTQCADGNCSRAPPQVRYPGSPASAQRGAPSLLRRYGSLEAALAQGNFAAQPEQLLLYRSIATMDASAPFPPLDDPPSQPRPVEVGFRRSSRLLRTSKLWDE